jgi:translation initiation factor eIF-2B subunit gamma
MLDFPLAWLEDGGIRDVLLITPSAQKPAIYHYIHSETTFPSLKIDLETIDDDESASMGTADVIRRFANHIQTDFIVLSCDFIPPSSLPFVAVLNAHRVHPSEPLMTGLFYERGEVIKDGPQPQTFCLDVRNESLAYVVEHEDEDEFEMPMSLMWRTQSIRLTTRYLDAHVYIFKKAVLDLILQKKSISSIREDLVPWLCKIQFQAGKRARWANVLNPTLNSQALALEHSTVHSLDQATKKERKAHLDSSRQSAAEQHKSPQAYPADTPHDELRLWAGLRCGIMVHHLADGYAARANTLGTYFELNRQSLREGSYKPLSMDTIDRQTQISSDSIIGPSTRIAEKTSVKKSVIGSHCIIGASVRIAGCIIMDHVVIGDGAKLENCILSRSTKIGARATLKDCESEPGYNVPPETSLKGERLEE